VPETVEIVSRSCEYDLALVCDGNTVCREVSLASVVAQLPDGEKRGSNLGKDMRFRCGCGKRWVEY
jgi:hypothetical protein